jgi:hypothetical protein
MIDNYASLPQNMTAMVDDKANWVSMVLYQFELAEDDQNKIFLSAVVWLLIHLIGWRLLTYISLWWKVNPDSTYRKIFGESAKFSTRGLTIVFVLLIMTVVTSVIVAVSV